MTMQTTPSKPGEAPRTSRGSILIVEDDSTLSDLLARVLRAEQYKVDVLHRADAKPPGDIGSYDAVISDIQLPGGNGYDVLKRVHAASATTPVILMTGFADVEGAMQSVSAGAYDYLPKPIDPALLKKMVSEAVTRRKLAASGGPPESGESSKRRIVGTSPGMISVYKTVAQVAPTTATVLIIGESGTGKELVAREVHAHSKRAEGPFIAVNCAALPESILESELFGHERGAFTGATGQKRGLFEEATGGTLFLDEIGEVTPKMQVQLLRVLQEGEIRRVGGSRPVKVDVRVVAATNRDLKVEVERGRFREDLLFRMQVVTIQVPPLRDRVQDIPSLVHHFLAAHAERLGRDVPRIAPGVIAKLQAYAFPGNVRELSHVVERSMLMAREGVITENDLPSEVTGKTAGAASTALADDWPTLAVLGRRYIDRVLALTGGNKTRAAEVLGIDRRTLNRMFARERNKKAAALGESAMLGANGSAGDEDDADDSE